MENESKYVLRDASEMVVAVQNHYGDISQFNRQIDGEYLVSCITTGDITGAWIALALGSCHENTIDDMIRDAKKLISTMTPAGDKTGILLNMPDEVIASIIVGFFAGLYLEIDCKVHTTPEKQYPAAMTKIREMLADKFDLSTKFAESAEKILGQFRFMEMISNRLFRDQPRFDSWCNQVVEMVSYNIAAGDLQQGEPLDPKELAYRFHLDSEGKNEVTPVESAAGCIGFAHMAVNTGLVDPERLEVIMHDLDFLIEEWVLALRS
jgi:hypothetical protein